MSVETRPISVLDDYSPITVLDVLQHGQIVKSRVWTESNLGLGTSPDPKTLEPDMKTLDTRCTGLLLINCVSELGITYAA